MRNQLLALSLGVVVFISTHCEAGGFFRRVPEVGEWARYEITSRYTLNVGEPDESSREGEGYMLLKCVGEELTHNRRHLWIEIRKGSNPESDAAIITKFLIPEDYLLDGATIDDNIRGWRWIKITVQGRTTEPKPLDLDMPASDLALLFAESTVTTGPMEERTIVVDGVPVTLSDTETTQIEEQRQLDSTPNVQIDAPDVQIRDAPCDDQAPDEPPPDVDGAVITVSTEAVWWPNEDLAFGIGSAELTTLMSLPGDYGFDTQSELRFDLVATGTDAVSDLPDHN